MRPNFSPYRDAVIDKWSKRMRTQAGIGSQASSRPWTRAFCLRCAAFLRIVTGCCAGPAFDAWMVHNWFRCRRTRERRWRRRDNGQQRRRRRRRYDVEIFGAGSTSSIARYLEAHCRSRILSSVTHLYDSIEAKEEEAQRRHPRNKGQTPQVRSDAKAAELHGPETLRL